MKFLIGWFVFIITLWCVLGQELKKPVCQTACTFEYNPQCGVSYINGKFEWGTYGNPCALRVYNCENPSRVRYAWTGVRECDTILPSATSDPPPKPVCNRACTKEYNPQCGLGYSNGRFNWGTYGNPCMLGVYNCENPNNIRYALTGVRECNTILPTASSDQPQCNSACPDIYQPVCGLGYYNGRYNWTTHGNSCSLGVYNCQNPNQKQHAIKDIGECSSIFPSRNS